MEESVRQIIVGEDVMPMSIHFEDTDPVASCLVRLLRPKNPEQYPEGSTPRCGWHAHGDSINDAVLAWTSHLANEHRGDWPDMFPEITDGR